MTASGASAAFLAIPVAEEYMLSGVMDYGGVSEGISRTSVTSNVWDPGGYYLGKRRVRATIKNRCLWVVGVQSRETQIMTNRFH